VLFLSSNSHICRIYSDLLEKTRSDADGKLPSKIANIKVFN